ncbi:Putrescine importer PuuP, partial [Pseudomonas sp. SIMBA_065]
TFLNLIGIESITRVNWILVVAQLVVIIVLVALSVLKLNGQAEAVSLLAPSHHEGFNVPLIMTGAAVLCLSFLGFDAVSTMAEETSNP